jgi:hypothetical protein
MAVAYKIGPVDLRFRDNASGTAVAGQYCLCPTEPGLEQFKQGGWTLPEPIRPDASEADATKIEAMNAAFMASCEAFKSGSQTWPQFRDAVAKAVKTRHGIA